MKISFFGNFGNKNLGNECTLQAIIKNVSRYLPEAEMTCICTNPEDTSSRHKIPAFPMSIQETRYKDQRKDRNRKRPLPSRVLGSMFIRAPRELKEWVRAFNVLKGSDMLIMTGTGMLTDFGEGRLGLPYEIFKWATVAKLRKCKVLFVSVGAEQISHPLSRWFIKCALSLADYRSYRDNFSKQYIKSIGFDTNRDWIYPDLAFSLPLSIIPEHMTRNLGKRVIGIGVMDYYGRGVNKEPDKSIYQNYINKIVAFITWMLENGYCVRMLLGDIMYDTHVLQDIRGLLESRGFDNGDGRIVAEPVYSVEQLLKQIASADIIISPRFHNVLLGLFLCKPVISIGYNQKNESLMAEFGLEGYCQHIWNLDVNKLIEQLIQIEKTGEKLIVNIKRREEEYRKILDEQYQFIFNL